MSGNRNSGNRTGRVSISDRSKTIAPRSPEDKRLKGIRKEPPPLDEVPPMPSSSWRDRRATQLWNRLAGRLVDHGMLTELDLDLLEITVHAWRLTEKAALEGDLRGANIVKVAGCLKQLGLSKDGRAVSGQKPTDLSAEHTSHLTGLFRNESK